MSSHKKIARIAGFLYLTFLVLGIFSFFYVPSKIFIDGNAMLTANNIVANELLFRFGIVSNLIGQVIFIFLALTLYQLFKDIRKSYARLMVVLVIASVPIAFLTILNQIACLVLLNDADFLKAFDPTQLQALSMFFYQLYNDGIIIVGIFWGLWLYPFGYLVFKSGFIPKIFGVLLIAGCFSFLIDSILFLLIPSYRNAISDLIMIPATIAELSMIAWLLIKGVQENIK